MKLALFRLIAVVLFWLGIALILPLPTLLANGALSVGLGWGFLPPASVGEWLARACMSIPLAGIGTGVIGLSGFFWEDDK